MRPGILLFDLGGVLIENDCFDALHALLGGRLAMAELRRRWLRSEAVRAFELGRTTPEAFAARFLHEWELSLTAEAFLREFVAWPRGFYAGAEALLTQLRGHFRLGCLSNSNVLHWSKFNGFAAYFDDAFSSHLLGRIKPDADVFTAVLDALRLPPPSVVFFDDSVANVAAAEAAGMRAFHVEGFAALAACLKEEVLF